jgi:hypothetical protein
MMPCATPFHGIFNVLPGVPVLPGHDTDEKVAVLEIQMGSVNFVTLSLPVVYY